MIRACWGIAFGASDAKFYTERGVLRKHSHSYVTEAQQSAVQNLASAARRVNPQQALSLYYKIPVQCSAEQLWQTLVDKIERPARYVTGVTDTRFEPLSDRRRLRIMQRHDTTVKEVAQADDQQFLTRFELRDHPQYEGYIQNTIEQSDGQTYLTYQLQWQAHSGEEDFPSVHQWFDKAVAGTVAAAEGGLHPSVP